MIERSSVLTSAGFQ
jgi:hypothetical protein